MDTVAAEQDTYTRQRVLLAMGCQAMAFSLLSTTFEFYYVKVFMNRYKIEEVWFQMAQFLFFIWNAINDPLFAYLQEKGLLKCISTRRESVLYCSPFFVISFLVPWFSWGTSPVVIGLHLIFTLLFWDSMFTFVGLAACALFTETTSNMKSRLKMTQFCAFGNLLGSLGVFFVEFVSDSMQNYVMFQWSTVLLAALSFLLYRYAGLNAHTEYDLEHMRENSQQSKAQIQHDDNTMNSSYWKLTLQILSNTSFLAFVFTNFLQEYHVTYLSNFMAIFCDELVPHNVVPKWVRSFLYGISQLLPNVLLILLNPLMTRIGYSVTFKISFVCKIVFGILLLVFGKFNSWFVMAFLILDRMFTNATFYLSNLPLADLTDADKRKNNRSHPISSVVFGTNALIVKPAISLAPVIVAAILNMYGYKDLQEKTISSKSLTKLHSVMLNLLGIQPVVIGIAQCIIWSQYDIPGKF